MIVKFELYRSKNPNELITSGQVQHEIEDTITVVLDNYIAKLIIDFINSLDIVKRYGRGYVGSSKITEIIIENCDNISYNKSTFKLLIDDMCKDVKITWNKD